MAVVNMLLWSLVGAFAGWLAGMDTRDRIGTRGDIIVGILIALLCGFVLSQVLPNTVDGSSFHAESLIITFLATFILLFLIRSLLGVRTPS